MAGERDKIQHNDLADNSVGTNNLMQLAVDATKTKTLDTGDSTGVNAETLPLGHTTLHPTIAEAIAAIGAGVSFTFDAFAGDGATQVFTLHATINLIYPYLVFYNGQFMTVGALNDYTVSGTSLSFNFIPVNNTPLYIFYVHV